MRLLELLPGPGNALLKAHLITYQIGDEKPYEALSYVWGDFDLTNTLIIDGQRLNISKNLHSIVKQLRLTDQNRTLWIDAVCINQQDSIERGAQVALMGQIYRQAHTVLCWLGEASTHRTSALNYLQRVANEAEQYINLKSTGDLWSVTGDDPVDGVETTSVVVSAMEAHLEAIYDSLWFTRLWITQEVSLARNPVILCGGSTISWKGLELATRVLARCMKGVRPPTNFPSSINNVWSLMHSRARYHLITRPVDAKPVHLEMDTLWSLGRLAWESRHQHCKDDRDRVFALLSLVSAGASYKIYVPKPFTPDYTRSVEWAYGQFWSRFGGYSSLFHAGLSRRGGFITNQNLSLKYVGNGWFGYDEKCLPSWCPDLRPNSKKWDPIFSSDYAASTPMHHMECHLGDVVKGPGPLMIRGHRFDIVSLGFYISRQFSPCQKFEDIIDFRKIIKLFVALQSAYGPYPSGQTWIEALGSALMTDMPSGPNGSKHPFQSYLHPRLDHDKLKRLWRMYLNDVIAENGVVWSKFEQVFTASWKAQMSGNFEKGQKFQFDPSVELTHDGQLVWKLHEYLGHVLQRHRFIITKHGWMGLAPPNTAPEDVVVVLGGPGTAFIVRDTSMVAMSKLIPIPFVPMEHRLGGMHRKHTQIVPSETEAPISQLLGPCYLQGVMEGELYTEKRYEEMLEWETDRAGTIPRPTIFLV